MVAEVAAQLAHAEGDDDAAVELLAAAVVRRGTLDHGSPEVVALLAALGPHADDRDRRRARRGRTPRTLTAFLAPVATSRARLADPPSLRGAGARSGAARGRGTPRAARTPRSPRADAISANVTGAATGPPVSSPRAASATCVTGLISTNPRSHDGRVSVGTKTLLPNVSGNITSAPSPCTDRGCPTTIASAVNTQHRANANTMTRPNAATTASGEVVIRKPSSSPSASMIRPDVR